MSARNSLLVDRASAALVAIDLQEPFLRTVFARNRTIAHCKLLIQAALIMNVPVITTLQYAQRMGGLLPEIAELFSVEMPAALDKLTFSCCGSDEFNSAIASTGRRQILICGVETHICVCQTALDLVHLGYQVHVAQDAVSSRTESRHAIGLEKLRTGGVIPCSAEQSVFEMLYEASAPQFKAIHALVK